MGLKPEREAELSEPVESMLTDAEPMRPAVGYRIAGDIQFRAAELEQEVAEARARYKSLERELWAARKGARKSHALATIALTASRGGLGATLGSVLGIAFYFAGIVTSPPILFGIVIAGYLLGALLKFGATENEDDNFPPAPPPRMF